MRLYCERRASPQTWLVVTLPGAGHRRLVSMVMLLLCFECYIFKTAKTTVVSVYLGIRRTFCIAGMFGFFSGFCDRFVAACDIEATYCIPWNVPLCGFNLDQFRLNGKFWIKLSFSCYKHIMFGHLNMTQRNKYLHAFKCHKDYRFDCCNSWKMVYCFTNRKKYFSLKND